MGVLGASGFEVKSILKGRAVDQDGQIPNGDHIIAVSYKIKYLFYIYLFIDFTYFYIFLLSLCVHVEYSSSNGFKQYISFLLIFKIMQLLILLLLVLFVWEYCVMGCLHCSVCF